MTTLPDWMIRSGEGMTAADHEALPEDVCRRIEIVDGAVVVRPSPRRAHQRIANRLVTALEAVTEPAFMAVGDVDLRLRDVPLLNRRPDVVVYEASLPDDEVLPTRSIDKPGEYAASGVRHFWRIEYDDSVINVLRYQLDLKTRTYALVGDDKGKLSIKDPIALELDLEALR